MRKLRMVSAQRPYSGVTMGKRVVIVGYSERLTVLKSIGFSTYEEYLESDLWKNLRSGILLGNNHKCRLCKKHTNTVHHLNYNKCTLLGTNQRFLLPLCTGCHYKIEFDENGNKLQVHEVYRKLKWIRGKKKSKPWIGLAHKAKNSQRRREKGS